MLNNSNNFLVSLYGSRIFSLSLQLETAIYGVTISFAIIAKERSSEIKDVVDNDMVEKSVLKGENYDVSVVGEKQKNL